MRKWRIEDSEELYNITGWGTSYFGINDKGHVVVTPRKDGVEVDLKELVDELQLRDVAAPMLVRFPDILDNRIEKIANCFKQASDEYEIRCGRLSKKSSVMERNSIWDWKPVPNLNFMR